MAETIKKENKFLVIKLEDIDNYFSQFTKGMFATPNEYETIHNIPFLTVVNELKNNNKYIVCNQDEPYAELIWQIILLGEKAKQSDKYNTKNICPHCNMDKRIRNPSGYCDHLYYPESCEACKERENNENKK